MEVQEITRPMGKTINSETQTAVKEESLSSSMGSIYCITSPSGKQYIGQTRHSLDHRFKQHKKSWNKCTALKNAFNKYGTDNMTIKELEKCTFDKLDEREIYYIDTNDYKIQFNFILQLNMSYFFLAMSMVYVLRTSHSYVRALFSKLNS